MTHNVEDENIQIQERYRLPHRYRNFAPAIALLALFVAIALIAGVFAAFYFMRTYFSWVILAWMAAAGVAPILGIAFLVVKLIKYIRAPQIIAMESTATLVRESGGNTQVFADKEIFAFETKDAKPTGNVLPQFAQTVDRDYEQLYANRAIQLPNPYYTPVSTVETNAETAYQPVSAMETRQVLPIDEVLQTLEAEKQNVEQQLDQQKRELIKQQIAKWHSLHVPLRSIAKIVNLEGRKYAIFKELCNELGINNE